MDTFGHNLWDQQGVIESSTQDGIDFLSGCLVDFFKKRAIIEHEYAKSMNKLSEQLKVATKQHGLLGASLSSTAAGIAFNASKLIAKKSYSEPEDSTLKTAWISLLDQNDSLANIHSNLAGFIENDLILAVKKQAKQFESQRKSLLTSIKACRNENQKNIDTLQKVKKTCEQACKQADDSMSSLEKAEKSPNITKAQEERYREEAYSKLKRAEEADEEYKQALETTNNLQKVHYTKELPEVINQVQALEKQRIEYTQSIFSKLIGYELNLIPDIKTSLSNAFKIVNEVDTFRDTMDFSIRNQSDKPFPDDLPYENVLEKLQEKRFRKRDETERLEGMSPSKAVKKALSKIKELEKQIDEAQSKRSGIETLSDAFWAQPQAPDSKTLLDLNNQLEDVEVHIDTLTLKKYKYEIFLNSMYEQHLRKSATDSDARIDPPELQAYDSAPVMPVLFADTKRGNQAQQLRDMLLGKIKPVFNVLQVPKLNVGVSGLSLDGSQPNLISERVLASFDFNGDYENDELPFKQGQYLTVLEKDDSGWWRAQDEAGKEGFIPHNYVKAV